MVAINLYLLLGLLQALLVVAVVLGIWIWRLRHTGKRLQRAQTQIEHLRALPTAADYLQTEIERAADAAASAQDQGRWTEVRAAYLAFELERVRATEPSSTPDLSALRKRLEALLQPQAAPPAAERPSEQPEIDEDNIDFPEMLQRQNQLLEALKVQVHGAISNSLDLQRCDEKVGMLELVGRELEVCTKMMEEENNFLRDQIQALLETS